MSEKDADKCNELFRKANELKELARISDENIHLFEDASKLYNETSEIIFSQILNDKNLDFNLKIKCTALGYYYNYETDTFCYFVFSKDLSVIDNEILKIKSSIEYLNFDKKTFFKNISIFVPSSMELNYSYLDKYGFLNEFKLFIV